MAPRYPSLYQINTRVFLQEIAQKLGRPATLDDVPSAMLEQCWWRGFDWVWFLGVWQTGPAAREVSRSNPVWRAEYRAQLPDLSEEDICGSPFAIRDYTTHADLGGDAALARLRDRMRHRGLRLMLDFVPNHTAPDHAWADAHPEYYVTADEVALAREPHNYCRKQTRQGERVFAHGRDPYFPGWPDTLQLKYRHPGTRAAMTGELLRIADRCDGVRCDMAMLLLPDVIQRTWGDLSQPRNGTAPVDAPFWPEAIPQVRERHPDFTFMAEVYWDLEWALQQQGFDYTYDKRFYDRLHSQDVGASRAHLCAELHFQNCSARFLENHDEPRAAAAFAKGTHQAAAVATFFVPGLRFMQEGQFEGRRVRPSMHLCRRPNEPVDSELSAFYGRLLEALEWPAVRDGAWRLLDCRPAWDGNPTWDRFLTYSWTRGGPSEVLVCVNYGPTQGQCYVNVPADGLAGKKVGLTDLTGKARYQRTGDDLAAHGLYLDLPAWGYHVFEIGVT